MYEDWKDRPEAYHYWVFCPSCAATGGHSIESPAGAIAIWNQRPDRGLCEWLNCQRCARVHRQAADGSIWKLCFEDEAKGAAHGYWLPKT